MQRLLKGSQDEVNLDANHLLNMRQTLSQCITRTERHGGNMRGKIKKKVLWRPFRRANAWQGHAFAARNGKWLVAQQHQCDAAMDVGNVSKVPGAKVDRAAQTRRWRR